MNWIRENRWQILLTIILAVLWSLIWDLPNFRSEPSKATGVDEKLLIKAYRDYNNQYFDGKLPAAVIDYELRNPEFMALTTVDSTGRFHISFNPFYVTAERNADLTMLHEQCHIQNWGDNHGKKWRACMLSLDMRSAFREELIDSFREDK